MADRTPTTFDGYVFDLDGTIYVGDDLLPGAATAIADLRAAGAKVAFLTNKPLELPSDFAAKLVRLGIPATAADVVSCTDALLLYLREHAPGATLLPIAEPLLCALLADNGFALTGDAVAADLVVVAFDRSFTYEKLHAAFVAVRRGARLVATNPDPWCPSPDGGMPDCGAILAAIETATGVLAEAVVGKPSAQMSRVVLERLGTAPDRTIMVGDRLGTDIRMAKLAGMASVLVMTGSTTGDELEASDLRPDYVLSGVGDLVALVG